MRNLMYRGVLVAGVGALLAVGTAGVFAQQGDKAAIIKARKDFMEDQQKAFNAPSGDRRREQAGRLLEAARGETSGALPGRHERSRLPRPDQCETRAVAEPRRGQGRAGEAARGRIETRRRGQDRRCADGGADRHRDLSRQLQRPLPRQIPPAAAALVRSRFPEGPRGRGLRVRRHGGCDLPSCLIGV
jgi:hypothetical protein